MTSRGRGACFGSVDNGRYSRLPGPVDQVVVIGDDRPQGIFGGCVIYPHQDHLGSPVAATNWAGTLQWREDYTPPLPGPSSPVCQSLGLNTLPTADRLRSGEKRQNPAGNQDSTGYTGHIQDDTTGLTYMQARYYDPVIGRFLSNDPVGFAPDRPDMFNRYAYVANDPVNMIDPTGELRFSINLSFKIAGGHGFKVGLNLNFDTETREIGGSVTGGYRAGAALAAKGEFYVEPSSQQGNQASIRGEVKVEAQAEVKAVVGNAEASGELEIVGAEASSETGLDANGPRLEGSAGANLGPASVDATTGRVTYSIGGGLGVAAGADVTISGNRSLDDEKNE